MTSSILLDELGVKAVYPTKNPIRAAARIGMNKESSDFLGRRRHR